MITDVHHTALFVTDLARSLPFYVDRLGFELVSRSDDWGGHFMDDVCGGVENFRINVALVKAGGEIVELIQILTPDALPTDATEQQIGIARIGFEIDDIEATVAGLRERCVEFMSDIVTVTVKPGEH